MQKLFVKANKNLLRNKLRNFLNLFSIIISAAVFVLIVYAGTGLENIAKDSYAEFSSTANTLFVSANDQYSQPQTEEGVQVYEDYNYNEVQGVENTKHISNEDIKKIKSIRSVEIVEPNLYFTPDYIQLNSRSQKKYFTQYNSENLKQDDKILAGQTLSENDTDGVVVSANLASVLGFKNPADAINQTFEAVFTPPFPESEANIKTSISVDSFREFQQKNRVVRTYTIKGVKPEISYGGEVNITKKEERQMYEKLFKNTPSYEKYYSIRVVMNENISEGEVIEIKKEIEKLGFSVSDNGGSGLNELLQVIKYFQFGGMGLAGVGLLAAFFGVINTQLMAVLERTKEVGLLRALGMSKDGIFWMFSIEAALIGLWGSVLGFGLATGATPLINSFFNSQNLNIFSDGRTVELLKYSPNVWFVVVGIIFFTFMAGVLPSIKASKQDPIESLRYE